MRAGWLAAATVLACIGLGESLGGKDTSERYLNPTSFSLYVGAVLLLASVAYAIHRLLFRESPQTARRRAAVDTLLTGFVTGPALLAAIVVVATIRECPFGTGC
jgi:hypothetical protein